MTIADDDRPRPKLAWRFYCGRLALLSLVGLLPTGVIATAEFLSPIAWFVALWLAFLPCYALGQKIGTDLEHFPTYAFVWSRAARMALMVSIVAGFVYGVLSDYAVLLMSRAPEASADLPDYYTAFFDVLLWFPVLWIACRAGFGMGLRRGLKAGV